MDLSRRSRCNLEIHGQFAIHTIFVVGILATVGATLYSFRMGHVQKVEEQQVLKINQLTQNLKQDRSFDKISKFLPCSLA